ncbi:MAG: hypothetical protein ABI885_11025 [Gammaproteobacteria bacterium]
MGAVQMPTVQHLLSGSLDALRQAIGSASVEQEPTRWVVSHIILGSALRLRSTTAHGESRAQMCSEAVRAFESALAVCCQRNDAGHLGVRDGAREISGNTFGLQPVSFAGGTDGVQLVVDATRVPLPEGNEMIERAIAVFRDACHKSNKRQDRRTWFIGMSNLGCTLTLLGRRTPGPDGTTILEEAIDVLQEGLRIPSFEGFGEERASTQINLAEAFEALAERCLPAESLLYVEQAADWLAAALSFFAPPEYRWLLQLERRTLS